MKLRTVLEAAGAAVFTLFGMCCAITLATIDEHRSRTQRARDVYPR